MRKTGTFFSAAMLFTAKNSSAHSMYAETVSVDGSKASRAPKICMEVATNAGPTDPRSIADKEEEWVTDMNRLSGKVSSHFRGHECPLTKN